MNLISVAAEITGITVWGLAAWAAANRAVTVLCRLEDERRRSRNARRLRSWRPQPSSRDPGEDLPRTLPAIQRPRRPQ